MYDSSQMKHKSTWECHQILGYSIYHAHQLHSNQLYHKFRNKYTVYFSCLAAIGWIHIT